MINLFENLVSLSLNFFGDKDSNHQELPVIGRINCLLNSHELELPQLLEIVPQAWGWSLDTVLAPENLLAELGHDQLIWFSEKFGVETAWLNEGSNHAHSPIFGYKNLDRFFETLCELGWAIPDLRLSILGEDYDANYGFLERYLLVLSVPAFHVESIDQTIYRHRIFDSMMNYHHMPCRLDTKAICRWHVENLGQIPAIPIIPVGTSEIQNIADGQQLISEVWTEQIGGFDRFEDRVLALDESVCAKETDELDEIRSYMQRCRLFTA